MKRVISLTICLALILSLCACASKPALSSDTPPDYTVLASAQYPVMAPYPIEMDYFNQKTGEFDDEGFYEVYKAWGDGKKAQMGYPERYTFFDGLKEYLTNSMSLFLSRSNGQNRAFSPLNTYMALSMLAELTGGESRSQILSLLGIEDIEQLRTQSSQVWNSSYCNDGATTSIPASSLWLDEDIEFNQSTMDNLAEYYYADAFMGEMGSEELNQALQDWLNEQTGGLLHEYVSDFELDSQTILALATTLYYRAKWADEFDPDNTAEGRFSILSADVETVPCDFMHQSRAKNYYWGEKFSAVSLRLENSGQMWLMLPDGDVPMDELLQDEEAMAFIRANGNWSKSKQLIVNLSLPKFDISSKLDLADGLKAMGITDVFDGSKSDFSPTMKNPEGMFVSKVEHAARVAIDEEGCTAAAYTAMALAGAGEPPTEEVDFVLDRPFLFVITGENSLPLFAGVVNRP